MRCGVVMNATIRIASPQRGQRNGSTSNRRRSNFEAIEEFEVHLDTRREMAELVVRIEVAAGKAGDVSTRVAERLHATLNLRADVDVVPPGTLPRYELKAKRFNVNG